ncbi:MAG: RagB/SusD family nutrient uptake outer membrane protein [Bacteroidales bacterium]|nr:RagB/SusD family nutrient uptake outer membrane protein [Bacteroidales bacterium]
MQTHINKILLGVLVLLTSCSLYETPPSEIPEGDAYKSTALLYINTVGSVTSGLGTVFKGNTDAFCTIQDIAGGQVFNPGRGGGDWQDGGKHQALFMHAWGDDNGYMSSGWNGGFNKIAAANKAIGTIEKYMESSKDKELLQDYIHELRAMRAIFYWYMLDMYGNVPICASVDQTINETATSPRKDVYEFVRDELCEAIPHLKEGKSQDESSNYYGRVTKAVGYFLMARLALNAPVYLLAPSTFATSNSNEAIAAAIDAKGKEIKINLDGTERNAWETVIYCQEQVAKMGYGLQPVFKDNFALNNGSGNIENIFVIPRDNVSHRVNDQDLQRTLHGNHGNVVGLSGCWNGISGTRQTAIRFGYETDGDTEYDPRWSDSFYFGYPEGEANKDKVKSGYEYDGAEDKDGIKDQMKYGYYYAHKVWSEQSTQLDAMGYTGTINTLYLKWGGARYKKYTFDPSCGGLLSNADYSIFRYADLLLMAGEAKYRNGGDGSAEIAAVRSRVGLSTDAAAIDYQFICEERTRELAWEGISRTDEIRFGNFTKPTIDRNAEIVPFMDTYGGWAEDTDGHTIIFAVPSSAMQTNPNIDQNPGY